MSKGRYTYARVKGTGRRQLSKPSGVSNRHTTDYGKDWPILSAYVRKRDNYQCQAYKIGLKRCHNRFPPPLTHLLHVHHKIPRAKGGLDHPKNLITLCCDCHLIGEHGRNLSKRITNKQQKYGRSL